MSASNMGRCVVCGKPIDLQDAGHTLAVMELGGADQPGLADYEIDEQDEREAMARALRSYGTPEDHALADAYESGEELIMHGECHDETSLSEIYIDEDEAEKYGLVDDESPESQDTDTQIVDTGRSKAHRMSKLLLATVRDYNTDTGRPAPVEEILNRAENHGVSRVEAREHLNNCQKRGEVYEPADGMVVATDAADELCTTETAQGGDSDE